MKSTVPGAISVLQQHMADVVAANPQLAAAAKIGQIVGTPPNNFVCIGDPSGGKMIDNYVSDYQGMARRTEAYDILCWVRAWSQVVDPVQRIEDAFTLTSGVMDAVATDLRASGAIGPGTWRVTEIATEHAGEMGNAGGWGVYLSFPVVVSNVLLVPN